MEKEIDWKRLWKLPEDLKKRVVKGKTPQSKSTGEISEWIAIALNRLDTHEEMKKIAKQISPTTKYKNFNSAITAYLNSTEEVKKKVQQGKVHILDLLKEKPLELTKEDVKNIERHNKARELRDHLKMFYNDLRFFLEGTIEDRQHLKKFLKPEKIHYLASILSCIRNEELLSGFLKHQGIKEWEDLK